MLTLVVIVRSVLPDMSFPTVCANLQVEKTRTSELLVMPPPSVPVDPAKVVIAAVTTARH